MIGQGFQGNNPRKKIRLFRILLIMAATVFLMLFLVMPLVMLFYHAFEKGLALYFSSFSSPDTLAAIKLSFLTTVIVVGINLIIGLCAVWALGKFEFRGKWLIYSLLDIPLSVSPVISGLIFVLLFGVNGWLGPLLDKIGIKIIFATPGIVIVTVFVTFPYIIREILPIMQEQGTDEEEASLVLGANGLKTFLFVTLPNIKWALLYGVVLCSARSMGEFGAVSVVSGHIRGLTNTLPLQVEILYNEYNFTAAFALASLLTMISLLTLVIKSFIEKKDIRIGRQIPKLTGKDL